MYEEAIRLYTIPISYKKHVMKLRQSTLLFSYLLLGSVRSSENMSDEEEEYWGN